MSEDLIAAAGSMAGLNAGIDTLSEWLSREKKPKKEKARWWRRCSKKE